jgi:hypothetical protein
MHCGPGPECSKLVHVSYAVREGSVLTRVHNTLLTLGARPLLLPAVVLADQEVAVAAVAVLYAFNGTLVLACFGEDWVHEGEKSEEKEEEDVHGGFHCGDVGWMLLFGCSRIAG